MHDEPLRLTAADQASRLTASDYTRPAGPAPGPSMTRRHARLTGLRGQDVHPGVAGVAGEFGQDAVAASPGPGGAGQHHLGDLVLMREFRQRIGRSEERLVWRASTCWL